MKVWQGKGCQYIDAGSLLIFSEDVHHSKAQVRGKTTCAEPTERVPMAPNNAARRYLLHCSGLDDTPALEVPNSAVAERQYCEACFPHSVYLDSACTLYGFPCRHHRATERDVLHSAASAGPTLP